MVRSRHVGAVGLLALVCAIAGDVAPLRAAGVVPVAPIFLPRELRADALSRPAELREALAKPVNLPKGIDPNTPLKDCLEFLSELMDVPIIMDRAAFKAEGIPDPEAAPVGLPRLTGVRFGSVLQQLLEASQLRVTYVVRYDHLLITTHARARPSTWVPGQRHLVPVVDVQFDRRPLEQALRDVAELTGVNVALDPRAADKAKVHLTLTLTQASADTAVFLLADMADLAAVALDTALYVTTKANAESLRAAANKGDLRQRIQTDDNAPAR